MKKERQQPTERDKAIVRLYFENHSLQEIGTRFNLSRERVRQIMREMGYAPRDYTRPVSRTIFPRKNHLTMRERFWLNVNIKGDDDCWEWRGYKDPAGYGRVGCSRKYKMTGGYAHRMAYMFHYRRSPNKYTLHSCDNPPCCNPRHLRSGTPQENMQDRQARRWGMWYGRTLFSFPKIITPSQAEMVLGLRREGYSIANISKQTNISDNTIGKIICGKYWTSDPSRVECFEARKRENEEV